MTLVQSTVTANHADHPTATAGGIWNGYPPIEISGSIVAGNTAGGGIPDLLPGTGALTVNYSVIGTGISPTSGANNVSTDTPLLGPLADNGGHTFTHALLPGSPAIDAGDPSFDPNAFNPPLVNDQRGVGFDRIADGGVNGVASTSATLRPRSPR